MKKLRDILENAGVKVVAGSTDIEIHSLEFDSRKAGPGCLYFAVKGTASDGHQFIPEAVKSGAVAIVCENIPEKTEVPIIHRVANTKTHM